MSKPDIFYPKITVMTALTETPPGDIRMNNRNVLALACSYTYYNIVDYLVLVAVHSAFHHCHTGRNHDDVDDSLAFVVHHGCHGNYNCMWVAVDQVPTVENVAVPK